MCCFCNKQFSSSYELEQHENTHVEKSRQFKCCTCDYMTTSQSLLMTHEKRHVGKPHKCAICGYKAAHPSLLRRHERIHTGEKPFKCQLCPYESSRSENLKRHQLRHEVWCTSCSKREFTFQCLYFSLVDCSGKHCLQFHLALLSLTTSLGFLKDVSLYLSKVILQSFLWTESLGSRISKPVTMQKYLLCSWHIRQNSLGCVIAVR